VVSGGAVDVDYGIAVEKQVHASHETWTSIVM
jgi:hypothetical protein